jgi:hypothetical protein
MTLEDRAARINRKLAGMLPKLDGVEPAPPVSEAVLTAFETEHGITLPGAYRVFRRLVSDGGFGPYYGVLPLARWEYFSGGTPAEPFPVGPGHEYPDPENWVTEIGWLTDDDWYTYRGVLAVSELGCGYFAGVVVTGEGRGRVIYTFNDERPPMFTPHADFLCWYETWLDGLLCGHSPPWYGVDVRDEATLLAVVNDTEADPPRRVAAALGLAVRGGVAGPSPDAVAALRAAASSEHTRLRGAALCALGRRPLRENPDILEAALADPVAQIVELAEWVS